MRLTEHLDLDGSILAAIDVLSGDAVVSRLLSGDGEKIQQVDVFLLGHLHSLSEDQRQSVSLPAHLGQRLAEHLSIQGDVLSSFHHDQVLHVDAQLHTRRNCTAGGERRIIVICK